MYDVFVVWNIQSKNVTNSVLAAKGHICIQDSTHVEPWRGHCWELPVLIGWQRSEPKL